MGDGEERPRGRRRSFPSPSSSSSSDFEFTVSLSPSSKRSAEHLCPADELFYKGQLLPLQLSPRISMVRTLLLASSSTSSSDATSTTASRDSNGSSSSTSTDALLLQVPDCDSSRPSSVTEEDACRRNISSSASKRRYLSSFTTRFSSVFLHRGSKKDPTFVPLSSSSATGPAADKKPPTSSSAKERIKKYVKKVKPLYEKLSSLQHKQSQQQPHAQQQKKTFSFSIRRERESSLSFMGSGSCKREEGVRRVFGRRTEILSSTLSFSGNPRYPCAASCPSSMRSSPSHSGLLSHGGGVPGGFPDADLPSAPSSSSSSSMEELQNAIQGAIAHCKSTMILARQKKAIDGFWES